MVEPAVPNKGPRLDAAAHILLVLVTIAVALRFCSRYVSNKAGFWWDDWIALIALPFVWANSAATIYWVHIGLGKHIEQAPAPLTEDAKVFFAQSLIYNTGLSLVKMSVLLFYVRVFNGVQLYRLIFWFLGFLIVGWCVAINFLAIFSCLPVQKLWNPKLEGQCIPLYPIFLGTAASNIIIDGLILLAPMPMLWRLHLDVKRKLALIGAFAAGYCVMILSVLRLVSILGPVDTRQSDITWDYVFAEILLTCEVPVGLISACLPSIFNLGKHGARRYFPKHFANLSESHPLSGPGGKHIGPAGNPIDDRKEKGLIQLRSDQSGATTSNERLYDGLEGLRHFTNAFTTSSDRQQEEADPEEGIQLHQIRVREDVEIDNRRRV